jgi:phosphocarrier protein HPr
MLGKGGVFLLNRTFQIKNKLGMHARAATAFVQTATRYESEIVVRKGELEVNGKSIMGVLQLAACRGQSIEIEVEGKDGQAALEALGDLIDNLFGEEE